VSVWLVIPSKRPEANLCAVAWRDMGYHVAMLREPGDGLNLSAATFTFPVATYIGWARSVNLLVGTIMARVPEAEWFVTGGDDYYPDPHRRAEDIAGECKEYFHQRYERPSEVFGLTNLPAAWPDTFGVMQPTGDRWSEGLCATCGGRGVINEHTYIVPGGIIPDASDRVVIACQDCSGSGQSAVIDRICGSPWMGREFCRRMYQGSGPLYNGYYHNFADEELQNVARKLGVFWQRRDLCQEHRHWARPRGDVRDMPEWAAKINDPKQSDWERSKALFQKRKAAGFPGHEPLEI
jgi:hypothetical protein